MNLQKTQFSNAIVLTGGIATGKSTIMQMFKEDNFAVIDADKIAHNVLEEEKEQIVKHFGSKILHNGIIDRKQLGSMVFKDFSKKKMLEDIVHPHIREKIFAFAKRGRLLM